MSDTWGRGPFLAFDTETTGVDVETARIVTATTVWIEAGRAEPTTWLINPGVEIPEQAAAVHGITTERARTEGRDPAECIEEIAESLRVAWGEGLAVVAFNARYDLTLLDREMRRHGLSPLECGPVIDPFVIDKHADPFRRGKRTLVAQCEHYGVKHEGAHDATADALAAARVAFRLAQRHATVGNTSLEDLHTAQIEWAREQAASFRDYLIKQGRTDDLPDGHWPLVPYEAQEAAA